MAYIASSETLPRGRRRHLAMESPLSTPSQRTGVGVSGLSKLVCSVPADHCPSMSTHHVYELLEKGVVAS